MNWDAILWLILLAGFLLVEAATVTMVSLWFAVGALFAMIASFWDAQMWLQVLLFLVVSGIMLVFYTQAAAYQCRCRGRLCRPRYAAD